MKLKTGVSNLVRPDTIWFENGYRIKRKGTVHRVDDSGSPLCYHENLGGQLDLEGKIQDVNCQLCLGQIFKTQPVREALING